MKPISLPQTPPKTRHKQMPYDINIQTLYTKYAYSV